MRPRRGGRLRLPRLASPVRFLPLALLLLGCGAGGPTPATHDGPILLVTLEGLRADVVGALGGPGGLTPHLDRLAAEADWAGRAVAPSSWGLPALASLWTGLRPWQHLAIVPRLGELGPELILLPEALAALGYRGVGFRYGGEALVDAGYGRGLERLAPFGRGDAAATHLRRLGGGRELVWVHLAAPAAPHPRRDAYLPRLGDPPPEGLPARVGPRDLEPFFDPAVPLPDARRRALWALYQLEVAWVDEQIGRLLSALQESGHAPHTLVAVASAYGQELGEHGQIGAGGNLGRALVDVPLIVRLPAGFGRPFAAPAGGPGRVGAARLWATVVEAAGGEAPPGVAPSLFSPAPRGVLSELYRAGAHNEFSLAEGEWQLRWQTPFATGERSYFRARRAELGIGPPWAGSPRRVFARLGRAFWRTLPLTGDGAPPRLLLERWTPEGVAAVDDPVRAREMAARLGRAWHRFVGAERTPQREADQRRRR